MKKESIISFEIEKEIKILSEIDELFRRFEQGEDVETELRNKIKEYRRIFGTEVQEEIKKYYKRLEEIKEAA